MPQPDFSESCKGPCSDRTRAQGVLAHYWRFVVSSDREADQPRTRLISFQRGAGAVAFAMTRGRMVFKLDRGNAVTDNAIAIKTTSRGATTL